MTRREEILAVARLLIAQQGYDGTSMRDIADAAGLLAGSLYSHFRSKADLVGEIVDHLYADLVPRQQAILSLDSNGAGQLEAMVAETFAVCVDRREEITIVHYDWHVLSRLDELANARAKSLETLVLWATVIERGQQDGSIVPTFDVETTVRMITGALHGLVDTVRIDARPPQTASAPERMANLVDMVLGGVLAQRPRRRKTTGVDSDRV